MHSYMSGKEEIVGLRGGAIQRFVASRNIWGLHSGYSHCAVGKRVRLRDLASIRSHFGSVGCAFS